MSNPSGWQTLPLKRLATCHDNLRIPVSEWERADMAGEIPYWGANSIQGYVDRALVDGETVLLGEDGAPFFDADKPVAFYVAEPIWPNNHVHVLKAVAGVNPRWLVYALNSVDYSRWINGSTRDKLTQNAMMNMELVAPPFSEQELIAAFLDRETAQIDAMIDAQQRLVHLLEERQAVVQWQTILGQPNHPDQFDSWFGAPPSHWVIDKLGRHARVLNGSTPSRENLDYWSSNGDGHLWLNSSYANADRVFAGD